MRRKKLPSFIDGERYHDKWENYKKGNVVTYKRISDGCTSSGLIKWFEITKSGEIVVTLIDTILDNYQSCYYHDIIDKPDPKVTKKIKSKLRKKAVS